MKKIGWIKISSRRYGGAIYGEKVRNSLSSDFDVELKTVKTKLSFKYFKPIEWVLNLLRLNGEKDLWIRDDFFTIALQSLSRTKGKKLALFYHIDLSNSPFYIKPAILISGLFYFNLKKSDAVVTIADYWSNYFLQKGYKNIYKVSPCLDLSKFSISDEEVKEFKRKYKFEDRPIVYLGNCQKAKGVVDSYQALKDLDVHLVTSGEKMVEIPIRNLDLSYREYLVLLKASVVALTMSKFEEGWNITAQEAMIVKTPVIGSGRAGMKELLEGGNQIICKDFAKLKEEVERLLNEPDRRKKMGEEGCAFASQFTDERFKRDWITIINKILDQ